MIPLSMKDVLDEMLHSIFETFSTETVGGSLWSSGKFLSSVQVSLQEETC